jgi:hypothetical protein
MDILAGILFEMDSHEPDSLGLAARARGKFDIAAAA